jgi:phage protein U
MYAQLGAIKFDGLFSFHEFERVSEAKYAEVDLIGGKPDLQRTGDALIDINVNFRFHESFCDCEASFSAIEAYRLNGDILPFVNGYGTILGNFVIEKIKQNVLNTDTFGRVTLCECEVALKEYADPNRAVTVSNNAKTNALALSATSLTVNIVSIPPNPNADIFNSMSIISVGSGSVIDGVNKASADSANVVSYFKNAVAAANQTYNEANKLETKITDYIAQGAGAYTGMLAMITAVKANLTALKTSLASGDIAGAVGGLATFQSSIFQLNTLALPVQELLILR